MGGSEVEESARVIKLHRNIVELAPYSRRLSNCIQYPWCSSLFRNFSVVHGVLARDGVVVRDSECIRDARSVDFAHTRPLIWEFHIFLITALCPW